MPPINRGQPVSSLWGSNPWPTLKGTDFDGLVAAAAPSTSVEAADAAPKTESVVAG